MFGSRRGFSQRRGGVELRLDYLEAAVLRDLFGQVDRLVAPGERPDDAGPLEELLDLAGGDRPDDPALMRLFPDGYRDDDAAAEEFRRFTERGLREAKSERLEQAMAVLDRVPQDRKPRPVPLTPAEADAFLRALNDLRLVLGVRLGIVSDDQDVASGWDVDDPRTATYGAYQWLTWLQAELLDAMAGATLADADADEPDDD